MPEVAYTTAMQLPMATVWAFVSDMNNWAPFLTGYQKHEVLDATDSLWTLKGEVGILSRRVELRAHVTEWVEPEKVSFTLTGRERGGRGRRHARAPQGIPRGVESAEPSTSRRPRQASSGASSAALARLLFRLTQTAVCPERSCPRRRGGRARRARVHAAHGCGRACGAARQRDARPRARACRRRPREEIAAHLTRAQSASAS